jgi:serine/threonine protein kinase
MARRSKYDPSYQAPEIIGSSGLEEIERFSCDFWSMGVIMYQMLSGLKPFQCDDVFELMDIIKQGDVDWDLLIK